jgi:DNA-binding NarL/FixJ family response regulator
VIHTTGPIKVAIIDDYDVVVVGVANMLEPYRDRVVVAELDTNKPLVDDVDVALYDSFAQPESDHDEVKTLIDNPRAAKVVIYTWNFHPDLLEMARDLGVDGYLSKALSARDLVAALESVHAGETVINEPATRTTRTTAGDWPGRSEGLSDREAEILALITQGKNNAEVAALTYLSPNTVKSYIRGLYRKIDVESRTQAVLWGVRHGFMPDHRRIDHWRGGP